jgi:hypothetical protein
MQDMCRFLFNFLDINLIMEFYKNELEFKKIIAYKKSLVSQTH